MTNESDLLGRHAETINLLGRRAAFDDRSKNFQVRALLTAASIAKPRSYTWSCKVVLSQQEGSCVGHAWAHEISARPVVKPVDRALAMKIYNWAQANDWWDDTPPEEGSSVLAGVKACVELGYYSEYRWTGAGTGRALEDLVIAIGYKGPVVLGINWYEDMFNPDPDGLLHPTGRIAGGHAILANAVRVVFHNVPVAERNFENINMQLSRVRLHNSWGPDWGINGEAFLTFEDMDRLLQEGGEACIPVRKR